MTTFDDTGLQAGLWTGILHAPAAPARLTLTHQGRDLAEASVTPAGPGRFAVAAPVPASVLGDGVTTLSLMAGADVLAHLHIAAGQPVEADLRADIALIRAELDLLKRELRRLATGG